MARKTRLMIIVGCMLVFGVIAYFVATRDVLFFDTVIREWFYSLRNDVATGIMKPLTFTGNWQFIVCICLLLLIIPMTRKNYGIPVAMAAVFISLFNKGIKYIFQRPRPDEAVHLIEESGFSFTSGHAITSMLVYGLLIYLIRRQMVNKTLANVLTVVLCVPLIGIGLSRIYLGVHFPTDVFGGWVLGLATLMGAIMLIENKGETKLK
ncbi:MAG: phosphatase PAP2 family protein [Anaerovoracaceae bacterium]